MSRKWQYSARLRSRVKLGVEFIKPSINHIAFPDIPLSPKLTILLVHKNGMKYLEETLKSIQNQTFQDYEVLVIDGASNDGSVALLESIPNLKVFSAPDEGFTDALKKGVLLARGEYITHCCVSDGYLSTTWLEDAIRALEKKPCASLVWGFPRTLDEEGLLQEVSYPDLHWIPKFSGIAQQFFLIRNGQHFPEGNLVVKTKVMVDILEALPNESKRHENLSFDVFLEFSYEFMKRRYSAIFLPIIANYGRIHKGSLTELDKVSNKTPVLKTRYALQIEELKKNYPFSSFSFVDSQGRECKTLNALTIKRERMLLEFSINFVSIVRNVYRLFYILFR